MVATAELRDGHYAMSRLGLVHQRLAEPRACWRRVNGLHLEFHPVSTQSIWSGAELFSCHDRCFSMDSMAVVSTGTGDINVMNSLCR